MQASARWGAVYQNTIDALNKGFLYYAVSPTGRIHESTDQRVEAGVGLFPVTQITELFI